MVKRPCMALILAVSLLAASSPAAVAQSPACATAPDAITPPAVVEDTDRIVRELRDGRIEAAAACIATIARLDAIAAKSALSSADLQALRALAEGDGLAVTETAPATSSATVSLADSDYQWIADSMSATRADQWVIVGLAIALFMVGHIIRAVTP